MKKQQQKKLNFWTSTPNSKMNFHLVINLIMRKKSLNSILLSKKTIVYISVVPFHIFSFLLIRQCMEFHFKDNRIWRTWELVVFCCNIKEKEKDLRKLKLNKFLVLQNSFKNRRGKEWRTHNNTKGLFSCVLPNRYQTSTWSFL